MSILCVKQEILTEQLCLWEEGELPSLPKPKSISDWFQWQVGIWTGGEITKDTSPLEIRTKICNIEQQMKEASSQGIMHDTVDDYELVHRFADNVYCREIHIPAGHVVVGKIHNHEHINFISRGRVTVITELGGIEELVAPCTLISPAGVKRLLVTHEDTVWSVVHSIEEQDLKKIEERVISPTFLDFKNFLIKEDYKRLLLEVKMSQEDLDIIMESQPYIKEMPPSFEYLIIKPSPISGLGVFTTKNIKAGDILGPARIGITRTPLGRYVNHSYEPNAEFRETPYGDLNSIALRDISSEEEILNDYRQGAQLWGASFNIEEQEKTLLLNKKRIQI